MLEVLPYVYKTYWALYDGTNGQDFIDYEWTGSEVTVTEDEGVLSIVRPPEWEGDTSGTHILVAGDHISVEAGVPGNVFHPVDFNSQYVLSPDA